jgi:hypothetical protein
MLFKFSLFSLTFGCKGSFFTMTKLMKMLTLEKCLVYNIIKTIVIHPIGQSVNKILILKLSCEKDKIK